MSKVCVYNWRSECIRAETFTTSAEAARYFDGLLTGMLQYGRIWQVDQRLDEYTVRLIQTDQPGITLLVQAFL